MDTNVVIAVITSITSAASTSGVAIRALVVNNKRFDFIVSRLDKIEGKLLGIDGRLKEMTIDIAKLKRGYR